MMAPIVAAGWVVAGVALGGVLAGLAAAGSRDRERRVLAVGLVIAALVYVVFGALAGEPGRVAVELVVAALFAVPAAAGARGSWWALAGGWLAHGVYDGAVHLAGPGGGPAWYAALCIGFDGIVAASAGRQWLAWREVNRTMAGPS
jgi:hypothetical protein